MSFLREKGDWTGGQGPGHAATVEVGKMEGVLFQMFYFSVLKFPFDSFSKKVSSISLLRSVFPLFISDAFTFIS